MGILLRSILKFQLILMLVVYPNHTLAHDLEMLPNLVESVGDSVVSISVVKMVKDTWIPTVEEMKKPRKPRKRRMVRSRGAGFIIDANGLIVTAEHIIKGAEKITIGLRDGTFLNAKIIGRDSKTNVALLKVKSKMRLKPVKFGNSSHVRIGDQVFSAGYRFRTNLTISSGVVSAINRDIRFGPYDDFIQTDANISKGHGGGPLFNMKGEVVGLCTSMMSPGGKWTGIGFCVPSHIVSFVTAQLKKYGKTRRGWLGVRIQPITVDIAESLGLDKPSGALVAGVTLNGPAEKYGLKSGDVVLKADGKTIHKMRDLPRIIAKIEPGKTVKIELVRDRQKRTIRVKLGRLEDARK